MKFKKPTQKQIIEYVITALIVITTLVMFISFSSREFSYKLYETSSVEYVKGRVTEVISQDLSEPDPVNGYITGNQVLAVEILEGKAKGEVVEITHYLTPDYQVVLHEGSSAIVHADIPENVEPYFSIYSFDRTVPVFVMILSFIVLVVMIGKKKGLMSCIALLFTFAMVICYLLPQLFEGGNGMGAIALTVIAGTAVTCFCVSGISQKTGLNFVSIILGCISAVMIYWIFMEMLHITGATMSESENLRFISNVTGLELKNVLFAGVTVSALGAVMDVAVSMGASLSEIKEIKPDITKKEIFRSGMNIGRDMIGTMTNTLILAFAGGTLAQLLIFISYGIQFHQLMSSDFIALELAAGIAGSAAVVLTVPLSAMVCAFGLSYKSKK